MKLNIYSFRGVLIERKWFSDLSYSLRVDINEFLNQNPNFDFKPGQWLSISIEKDNAKITKPYSIANSPKEMRYSHTLEFLIKIVNTKGVSKKLSELDLGSNLWLKGPYGLFTLQDFEKPKLFIATGTGLAPIKSMITALYEENPNAKAVLLYGCRNETELYYKELFEHISLKNKSFKYFYILSKPMSEWTGYKGHVQLLIDKSLQEGIINTDFEVYICGSLNNVRDISNFCRSKGFKKLFFERY